MQFETVKAVLKASSSKILAKYPGYYLCISGHTDNQGNDEANQVLSEKRAQACADFLSGKGVDAKRLQAAGFGETKQVASNKTAKGRTSNRRVEFDLVFPEG